MTLRIQYRASTFMEEWQSLALPSNQPGTDGTIVGTFEVEDSWSLTYNLYAGLLLGTGLVPQSVSIYSVCAIVVSDTSFRYSMLIRTLFVPEWELVRQGEK